MDVSFWGEKKQCVKTDKIKFNGIYWVGYYAAISMWRWCLHVFVGSYVSFDRSPYRRAFIEEFTNTCKIIYK